MSKEILFDLFCDYYLEKMLFQNILHFIFHSFIIPMNLEIIHFLRHFNSATDMFNFDIKDVETTKARVRKLLKVNYYLRIICEEPLRLRRI